MTTMISVPVSKEGKRLEASLGRSIEKVVKANTDALWARFQEENTKHEKLERDRMQQLTNLITNCVNKDLPGTLEKTLKKEISAVGPAVARAITPILEKSISSAITESFQKGVGEKAVNQLEKSVSSKLEGTVARQIQSQFQTSGKQALQDALRSSLEAAIIPAFEMSCKSMFDQIDSTFQKGFIDHLHAIQQQFDSTHSHLAIALRDAISSASSITQTLSGRLAEGQRNLLAIAAAGANSKVGNPSLSNGPLAGLHEMAEAHLDPTKELSRLIAECKFEEAFTAALHRSDVTIVSWLCSQVDLQEILSMVPLPLSQGVLLALLQQLACDISKETSRKLAWMTDVAVAINPADPLIALHVRPIFDQKISRNGAGEQQERTRGIRGQGLDTEDRKSNIGNISIQLSDYDHEDNSYSSDNYLALGVFDFPWLKEGTVSKSKDWRFEDSFACFLHDNYTMAALPEFSGQCLSETPETCVESIDIIPLEKFEETVWSLEKEGADA
ncbi:hypothetical protein GH714_039523 [Hevea brasiliensis]|uniref:Enhancer of mRNA-decapping protein 4 C-terminal domain-containing protein n=1 Tax=Hevea brasiliensis TaxID=3981 RepID=A0A6A6MHC2_HEVBR|nr:hypothetical protein GH714_043810 [Hevea brasiliensis]KAF2312674.1 hypothetical protein GH714_039523 [Hevea brasiliensis]